MIQAGKKKKEFADPYTWPVVTKGNIITKLSCLLWLQNNAQMICKRGLMFLVVEIGYMVYDPIRNFMNLSMFPSFGMERAGKSLEWKKSIYKVHCRWSVIPDPVVWSYNDLYYIDVYRCVERGSKSSYKSSSKIRESTWTPFETSRVCLIKIYINYYLRWADHGEWLPVFYASFHWSIIFPWHLVTTFSKVNDHLHYLTRVGLCKLCKNLKFERQSSIR